MGHLCGFLGDPDSSPHAHKAHTLTMVTPALQSRICATSPAFLMWIMGHGTRVLMLVWQALYQLSYLPRPLTACSFMRQGLNKVAQAGPELSVLLPRPPGRVLAFYPPFAHPGTSLSMSTWACLGRFLPQGSWVCPRSVHFHMPIKGVRYSQTNSSLITATY